MRVKFRPMPWLTAIVAVMLVILISLAGRSGGVSDGPSADIPDGFGARDCFG